MKHLHPRAAYELLRDQPDAVLIDCRSETEHHFVGHPIGARHVAWSDAPHWAINVEFVEQVGSFAPFDRTLVVFCRSGNRSIDAAAALERAGYGSVYNVLHGFEGDLDAHNHRGTLNGWRYDGLPWEQT